MVTEQWFNQTLWVRYFTKIFLCISIVLSVNKSDTMCWIIYCFVLLVHLCIQLLFEKDSLNSDFIRHNMLDFLLSWVQLLSWFDCSTRQAMCVSKFTAPKFLVHFVHLATKLWFEKTHGTGYFTNKTLIHLNSLTSI